MQDVEASRTEPTAVNRIQFRLGQAILSRRYGISQAQIFYKPTRCRSNYRWKECIVNGSWTICYHFLLTAQSHSMRVVASECLIFQWRLKATLERLQRLTQSYTDNLLSIFPTRVNALGSALGLPDETVQVPHSHGLQKVMSRPDYSPILHFNLSGEDIIHLLV